MSNHNIGFNDNLTKIIFELSSNTHLIFSSAFELAQLIVDMSRTPDEQLLYLRAFNFNLKPIFSSLSWLAEAQLRWVFCDN